MVQLLGTQLVTFWYLLILFHSNTGKNFFSWNIHISVVCNAAMKSVEQSSLRRIIFILWKLELFRTEVGRMSSFVGFCRRICLQFTYNSIVADTSVEEVPHCLDEYFAGVWYVGTTIHHIEEF